MATKTFKYESDDVTVSYDVDRCIHFGACVRGLQGVFDPKRKPWVDADQAPADDISETVMRCPTGALKFHRKDGGTQESAAAENSVTVSEDGPLFVRGDVIVETTGGDVIVEDVRVAFCRCGATSNSPFCDGSHVGGSFKNDGALGVGGVKNVDFREDTKRLSVLVSPNGPLTLRGPFVIRSADGSDVREGNVASLCGCGASANKPFCDQTHRETGFER